MLCCFWICSNFLRYSGFISRWISPDSAIIFNLSQTIYKTLLSFYAEPKIPRSLIFQ
jgi:hypothetical protein